METSLEIECKNCGNNFWHSGDKKYPLTKECPKCLQKITIPEQG